MSYMFSKHSSIGMLYWHLIAQFFYKATLLQQVEELLQDIEKQLEKANVDVDVLEGSIRPIERELNELQEKIKNMVHIEEISQQAKQLKKKLAWSWVYDVDRQLQHQNAKIGKLKDRVPLCQAKIDQFTVSISSWLSMWTHYLIYFCVSC